VTVLGAKIANIGDAAVSLGLGTMAEVAEGAGARALWVSDHILMTERVESRYPYSESGDVSWTPQTAWFEALACCAWIAARTSEATVGPAVLVLPQRDPLLLAKTAATIDALSGGRLVLGLGAGWYEEEFKALGWDFATRGRRMDEAIGILRSCWTGAPEQFDGEFFQLPAGIVCHPRPVSPAGVPLLIGGMSRRAVARAAALGDGWLGLVRIDALEIEQLAALLEDARARRPAEKPPLRLVLRVSGSIRRSNLEAAAETLLSVAKLGFDEVAIDPPWEHGLDEAGEVVAALAEVLAGDG
jgi:probable F420-dependent oxidoreductase